MYAQARAREEYSRYQRTEYEASFHTQKRRMEIVFVALCMFFILMWFLPSFVNNITSSRTKGLGLDEEVETASFPAVDVFVDLHRRMSERFLLRSDNDQVLTDDIAAMLVQQLPEAEREKIREVCTLPCCCNFFFSLFR